MHELDLEAEEELIPIACHIMKSLAFDKPIDLDNKSQEYLREDMVNTLLIFINITS